MPTRGDVTALPFILTASLEQPVPVGRPVVLTLALRNSGTERHLIGGGAFEPSAFRLAVTDAAGRPVPRTADGDRVLTPPTSASANPIVMIDSGQTLQYRFNLARLFDLSRPGAYAVSVARTLAPWPFPVSPTPPGKPSPPKVTDLALGPLKFSVVEDPEAASGPVPLTPPPGRRFFLYMVSQYDTGVARYRVGPDGSLSFASDPTRISTAQVGKFANSLVATPDGRFLYACNGSDGTVSQFRTGDDGWVTPLSPPTVPTGQNPWFLLIDPKGRFLYASSSAGTVRYAIGPDGRLTPHPRPASQAWDPAHDITSAYAGAIDPTGTFLYLCNGLTYGYRLAPDGTATALPPPAPGPARSAVSHDNAIALSPSGRFAFVGVSTKGDSASFDLVAPMRVAADGTLVPLPGVRTPQRPAYQAPDFTTLTVDPSGRFLIVVRPDALGCFRVGDNGSLTPLGMTQVKGNLDSVFFVPGGQVAYVINRNPSSLLAFRLDERRGLVPADVDTPTDVPFAASVASGVAPTPPQWGPAVGGLAVSARLPGDVLPADRPVVLTVVLKNVTARPLRLGAAGADLSSFRLSLTGPQRQSPGALTGPGEPAVAPVPLRAAGHALFSTPGPDTTALVLPPGGERQYRFVLSRLADLTVAGNYTVQVGRVLPNGEVASSPSLYALLQGPFDGITRGGGGAAGQGLDVL